MVAINGNRIEISGAAAKPASVWLVRYEPRIIDVAIKAGENGGRTLPHRNIVRELIRLGNWQGGAASFVVPVASLPGLATAAFVQAGTGGPIIAAVRG
jgi:hypothetical protein